MQEFIDRFRFNPARSLDVGVERECFLTQNGKDIIPIAFKVLEALPHSDKFGYELSACQLEERIGPCNIDNLEAEFQKNDRAIKRAEEKLGFKRLHIEVAPVDIPLDVFPDPKGRYQQITEHMSRERLLAACRVAAVHVHIGMPDYETALRVYNHAIGYLGNLCEMGDGSNGERLQIYREMAPDYLPRTYLDWHDFYSEAQEKGFINDPRQCWHLIRISVHGTIEFRPFGSIRCIQTIGSWARECHRICKEGMIS